MYRDKFGLSVKSSLSLPLSKTLSLFINNNSNLSVILNNMCNRSTHAFQNSIEVKGDKM